MSKRQTHEETAAADPSPQEQIMHVLLGMWSAQAVATAARLGIADALSNSQPQSSTMLAQQIDADAAALSRFLRALASLGILSQPEAGTYALTTLGETLRSDVPGSMRDLLIAETDTPHWQAWGTLDESVRTGLPRVPEIFGMPVFDYYGAHPEELAAFSRAMGNFSTMAAHGTLDSYDFSAARLIMDIGGANGDLLLAILQANPGVRGTLFDMPHVVEAARESVSSRDGSERCAFVGGDFFKEIPEGGDLLMLKFILHDWNDEDSVRILRNCRKAIAADGKLLIIEMVIPEDNHPSPAQLVDLNMLVMTGGRERTASEYGALFSQSGFRLQRVIPTATPYTLVEAVAE